MCAEWDSYDRFVEDMGDAPRRHYLARIDTNVGFHPDNCVWAEKLQRLAPQYRMDELHGTRTGYRLGCRCDECRSFNAKRARAYRESLK